MDARRLLVVITSLVAAVACKKDEARPPPLPPAEVGARGTTAAAAPASWYRAALEGPDGPLVFLLGLPAPGAGGAAVLISGVDRVERAATWDGTALRIDFPVYQTSLIARRGDDGALRGTYESRSKSFGATTLPLVATPIDGPSVAAMATVTEGAPVDLGEARTVWKVTLVEVGAARLELEQLAPGDFHGVLTFPNGNHSYMGGNGRGDAIVLTSFDGAAPSRLTLALAADRKTATGEWLTSQNLDWRERLTAERVADVALASSQPSPTGQTIDLPQLKGLEGKPVILELAGSWCSSCKNAAPVLRTLYDEHADDGLAIVTLLYEFTEDEQANREQARIFQETYGIPWKVEAVPGSPDEIADVLPPGFEEARVGGFPLAIFLTRDRKVAAVHASFPVAGTPAHAEAVAAYREGVALILGAK